MRRKKTAQPLNAAFSQLLRDNGWLLKTAPMDILAGMGIDDEFVYVERSDRLVHLHISAGTIQWEAKRYTREPFGDYTVAYRALGSGSGLASLTAFLDGRKPQEIVS